MGIRTHQNSRNVGTVSPQLKLPPKQCSPYLTFSHETFFHLKYFCSPCYHFFPSKKCVGFPYNHSRNKGKKISFHLLLKKNTQQKKNNSVVQTFQVELGPSPGKAIPKNVNRRHLFARHRHLHLEPFQHGAHATDLLKTNDKHSNRKHKFPISSQYTFNFL